MAIDAAAFQQIEDKPIESASCSELQTVLIAMHAGKATLSTLCLSSHYMIGVAKEPRLNILLKHSLM